MLKNLFQKKIGTASETQEAYILNNQMSIPHLVQAVPWHSDMGEPASVLSHSQRLNVCREHLGSLQVS